MEGVPHQRLCWPRDEIGAQCRQRSLQTPGFAAQTLNPQAVEAQPHRQIIGQRDRGFPVGRVMGMLLPPVHHAGPAGQFQGKAGQIAFPARFGQTQPAQFGADRFNGVIGPAGQRRAPAGQSGEGPGQIAARQPPPGRVQSFGSVGQTPCGQPLVEMGGAQADQNRADPVEHVLAGERPQQPAQRASGAHVREQPLDQRPRFRPHVLMHAWLLFLPRTLRLEPRQQGFRQI